MAEFEGKVVLVTGAGRGIGRAIAQAFAARGAILALNDLTPVNLDETVDLIRLAGGQARDYVFDIAKKMPVEEMVAEVLEDNGRIDILINNAGVHPAMSLLDMDEWDLRRTLDVNLCGAFFTVQLVGRAMRSQGGGVILNIAAAPELPGNAAFVASKMGLIGLTWAAARELAPDHIRVNALCPGWTDTEAARLSLRGGAPQAASRNSVGPPGQPADVASMALYLCSLEAARLTGQAINLDGSVAFT
jgi:3-oxoacyl-[acyl-carrier protein] reductase